MDQIPSSPWELYALMQHHGLPTRLLDWSRSPLHALYFALSQEQESAEPRVVWVLPPHELNASTIAVPSVYCPGVLQTRWIESDKGSVKNLDAYLPDALDPLDHGQLPRFPMAIETPWSHPRVRAQYGCFTIHGKLDDPLQIYFPQFDPAYVAGRLLITGDNQENLRVLHGLGIDEEAVRQDLDGLAARIRREQSQGIKTKSRRLAT